MFFEKEYNKFDRTLEGKVNFLLDTGDSVNYMAFRPTREVLFDIVTYKRSLTKSFQKIFEYFFNTKRKLKRIKLLNSTIAVACGVSKRTVIRATNKFQSDGLIYKVQFFARDVNEYMMSPFLKTGKPSFDLWLNCMSDKDRLLYRDHGLMPNGYYPMEKKFPERSIRASVNSRFKKRFVTLNINTELKRDIYINKNKKRCSGGIDVIKKNNTFTKFSVVVKTYVETPISRCPDMNNSLAEYDALEFNKTQQSIISLFNLKPSEKLKLFSFPDSAWEHAKDSSRLKNIACDFKGWLWLLNACISYCKNMHIRPDWDRYQRLCALYGVTPDKQNHSVQISKPRMVVTPVQKPDSLEYLAREIVSWKSKIAEFEANPNPVSFMVDFAKKRLEQVEQEFKERLSNDSQN